MTRRKIEILLAQLAIAGVWILVFGWGRDSYILIHDNLDSVVTWLRVLRLSGTSYLSASRIVPNLMNGVPAFLLSSGFNLGELAHVLLGGLPALALNDLVVKLVAFWGMYLLLARRVLAPGEPRELAIGVALCFALLPFWPGGFLSVAGQPFLLLAFLNALDGRDGPRDWLVFLLYPICSNLALAGFAVLLLLLVLFVLRVGVRRGRNWRRPAIALALLGGLSILASYKILLGAFFQEGFVSHRVSFVPTEFSLAQASELAARNFLLGHYQAASLQGTVILLAVASSFVLMAARRRFDRRYVVFLGACLFLSLFFGIWLYSKPALPDQLLLRGFSWERLHFLHPILWYFLFAVCLGILLREIGARRPRLARGLVGALLLGQAVFIVHGNEHLREATRSQMSYSEFFSEALFREIGEYIGLPRESYRVVSLGMHPAVAQHNGFFTLDAYLASYDLEYKKRFRRVIAGELARSEELRKYYDDWGSRCYLFASELDPGFFLYGKRNRETRAVQPVRLDVDLEALREMGGRYIFSAVPIAVAPGGGLRFLKRFDRDDAGWTVRLYEVAPAHRPEPDASGPR